MNRKESALIRQRDEFKSLQAIFPDEVLDLRSNKNEPLNFYITLKPSAGSSINEEVHAEICLHVQCSNEYPNRIPTFDQLKSKGLSRQQISDLLLQLKNEAQKKIGEEMIYDLAILVQEFLVTFNKPRYRSFYEEMLVLKEEEKKRVETLANKLQETQRLAIQEEVHRKQEELKAELKAEGRQRKESWHYTRDPIICNADLSEPDEKMESPYMKKEIIIRNEVDPESGSEEENDDLLMPCNAQSRFYSDYENMKKLGRGAYGRVLKARNKIDGRDYAIKRIKLDPLNDKMQKRMQSEVRTLSRLDHENVVRYYTSWIEQYTIDTEAMPAKKDGGSDFTDGSIPVTDVEVSHAEADVSDSDSESDEHQWRAHYIRETSEYILFEDSQKDNTMDEVDSANNGFDDDTDEGVTSRSGTPNTLKFMYIQMEFCEKSTLRTAIDNGLCYNVRRVWRLFREIVEGLAHIHSKNIMHRDLKPVNIFINSEDHVKIGDFGLAVMTDLSRPFLIKEKEVQEVCVGSLEMYTGLIGTALYVAPEVDSTAKRALYNKKVDIYSLGVIMFEMCYEPLQTAMERTKVLTNLRLPEIKLPDNFPQDKLRMQTEVIRWLLDHNPAKRPTAEELLSSNLLPPPEVEDAHLQEMLRHAFSNETNSKHFNRIIAACFSQKLSPAKDAAYNASLPMKRGLSLPSLTAVMCAVKEKILKVFHKHGASCIVTPLLMPCNSYQTSSTVNLMTQDGAIVSLPHDLRVSFARYVVYNKLTCVKRYAIQRVFRERKSNFVHPRELFECAFDIVTPNPGNLTSDAELLSVVYDILADFPHLDGTQMKIKLNHSELFRAMLLNCNVTDKKTQFELFTISHEAVDNIYLRAELHAKLVFLNASETAISNFLTLFDLENDFGKASATLKHCIKQRDAMCVLKKALRDLELVVQNAREFGVDWTIQLCPSLLRGIMHYSGVMCEVSWIKLGRQNRSKVHILAAGGRYDAMLSSIGENLKKAEEVKIQSAAGISLCMDRLVEMYGVSTTSGWLDTVLWAADSSIPVRKLTSICRSLWDGGVRCQIMDGIKEMAEIESFCQEAGVVFMVILRESDTEFVRIRSLDSKMMTESKVPVRDVVDYLQRSLRQNSPNTTTEIPTHPLQASRQESRGSGGGDSATFNSQSLNNWGANWNISYISNEKGDRRRIKANIRKKLYNQIKIFDAKTNVEIIAVPNVDFHCLNSLVGALDLDSEDKYDRSSFDVLSRTPPRQKEELSDVLSAVRDLHFENCVPVIVLYSMTSNKSCVLLCDKL